ncbi:MAG TPA: hypothetical protein VI168_04590 [Croceibacterium sp.]
MNEYGWVSLIAMSGCLALALGSYRAHRIGVGKTVVMALAWTAIFLLVAGIFAAIGA